MVDPVEPIVVSHTSKKLTDSSNRIVQKMLAEASRDGSDTAELQHLLLGLGLWLHELGKPIYSDLFGELSLADLRKRLPPSKEKGTVQATKTSAKVDKVFTKANELANGSDVSGQHLLLAFFELYVEEEPIKILRLAITPQKIKEEFEMN